MLEKIEKKLYKYSIDNLINYILIIIVAGFILDFVNPTFYDTYLSLDFAKIQSGEIWRLISFILYNNDSKDLLGIIFLGFSCLFYLFIGNGLNVIWGKFWFNTYIFAGIIFNVLGSFVVYLITGQSISFGIEFVLESMFLAFAVLFSEMKINFYFIIPIKVKWLGILYLGLTLIIAVSNFAMGTVLGICTGVLILISLLNFGIFFLLTAQRQRKQTNRLQKLFEDVVKLQKKAQEAGTLNSSETVKPENKKIVPKTYHKCCICGRTELDDPDLEFRYCSKCNGEAEYCSDHLFTHEHKK